MTIGSDVHSEVGLTTATTSTCTSTGAVSNEKRAGQEVIGERGSPDMEILIAATALAHDPILVTHNVQHFANVPALDIQDWLGP